jgi:hypothetical protein
LKIRTGITSPTSTCVSAGDKAAISIDDGRMLAGGFPPKQLKMVQAWIEIHKDELLADWELAKAGEQPYPIDPLR